jgi:hypothetical protein
LHILFTIRGMVAAAAGDCVFLLVAAIASRFRELPMRVAHLLHRA